MPVLFGLMKSKGWQGYIASVCRDEEVGGRRSEAGDRRSDLRPLPSALRPPPSPARRLLVGVGGAEEYFFEVRIARLPRELLGNRLHGPDDDFPAIFQDQNVGANLFHQVQQMRADNDGRAVARAFQDRIFHAPNAQWVQPRE